MNELFDLYNSLSDTFKKQGYVNHGIFVFCGMHKKLTITFWFTTSMGRNEICFSGPQEAIKHLKSLL